MALPAKEGESLGTAKAIVNSNAIEKRDGIIFGFYTGLSHLH